MYDLLKEEEEGNRDFLSEKRLHIIKKPKGNTGSAYLTFWNHFGVSSILRFSTNLGQRPLNLGVRIVVHLRYYFAGYKCTQR